MEDAEVKGDTALGEDNLVNAVFASAVAGGAWMGLGGFLLGLAVLAGFSRLEHLHQGDLALAGAIGLFIAANGGVIAGALHAAVPSRRQTLVTTLAAGLANPFLYSDGFEIFRDMLDSPGEAATNLAISLLPFFFGWLFARGMAGTRRMPLISWARRNVERVPDGLAWKRRASAVAYGGIPAWTVVMAGAAAFAYAFSQLETLLPLPPQPPGSD